MGASVTGRWQADDAVSWVTMEPELNEQGEGAAGARRCMVFIQTDLGRPWCCRRYEIRQKCTCDSKEHEEMDSTFTQAEFVQGPSYPGYTGCPN